MQLSYQTQKIAVLIDTANMYHTAKHLYSGRVQFSTLCEDAVSGRNLIRAIAYAVTTEGGEEKQFMENLRTLGIEVKTKDLIIYKSGDKKADWDVGIAIDAVSLASHIDTLVLVSGDGDFVPLLQYMQSRGIRCEVMSFEQSTSQMLIDACDEHINMSIDPYRYVFANAVTRNSANKSRNDMSKNREIKQNVSRETTQNLASMPIQTKQNQNPNQDVKKQPTVQQKTIPVVRATINTNQTPVQAQHANTALVASETIKPKAKKRFYPRKKIGT